MVAGEQRPKPIGGAWAQKFEDPGTRLVYLIRPALEGMSHATAALFGPDHPAADDIGAAYEALPTLRHELEDQTADIARTRCAWASIPAPLVGILRELSEGCLDMAFKAANVVESHGEVGVAEVDRGDEVDRLEQALFAQLLSLSAGMDVDAAIDLTLLAVGAPGN